MRVSLTSHFGAKVERKLQTHAKRYDLAQTMQCIGVLGVARMVQTGNVLGTGFSLQS